MQNPYGKGKINSIQTLGTLDGPGVRFVIFLQGCPLRCGCCHNPETWDESGGYEATAEEIFEKVKRYKEYFGKDGGVTVSGGEPLLQAEFVEKLFSLCKEEKIHTCLDTSGCILNEPIKKMLSLTDLVLLDIKYTTDTLYKQHVGCSLSNVLVFLGYLNEIKRDTWLRQVIIPGKNDDEKNFAELKRIAKEHDCVKKCELLAFSKLCSPKYEKLGIPYPFNNIEDISQERLFECQKKLDS